MNYKGMNMDMTCQGFQYEQGKKYEHDGPVKCCPTQSDLEAGAGGFHACEYPLDVFNYYPPAGSRFFKVEQSGDMDKASNDTKVASKKIKIGAEVSIAGLVKAAVQYTMERAEKTGAEHTTGDLGAASATGGRGAASATGYRGAASATGSRGAASATGSRGAASATGDWGAASATGYQGAASATGYQGAASATGDLGAASATGRSCVALSSGICGMAMGTIGNAICVVERGEWDGETYPIISIKAAIVDGVNIKENVYYTVKNGKWVEADV